MLDIPILRSLKIDADIKGSSKFHGDILIVNERL